MPTPETNGMDVALLVPCFVDQLSPAVAVATVDVLERAGCRVLYDARQTCCGQPFLTAGARREAAGLARAQLDLLRGADAVVCPSASCTATVRRRYAKLLPDLSEPEADTCARTFELGEFLVDQLGISSLGARFPHRVALLHSCHGLRELGLGQPSERKPLETAGPGSTEILLDHVDGLELLHSDRADECCGFGGLFAVDFPELSVRMGRDRLRRLAETGADYVTATDASCLLHLEGLRRREGYGPRPIHVAEILAQRGDA